jgi:hypothetical protein
MEFLTAAQTGRLRNPQLRLRRDFFVEVERENLIVNYVKSTRLNKIKD